MVKSQELTGPSAVNFVLIWALSWGQILRLCPCTTCWAEEKPPISSSCQEELHLCFLPDAQLLIFISSGDKWMAHGILLSILREFKRSPYMKTWWTMYIVWVGSTWNSHPWACCNLGMGAARRNKKLKNIIAKVGILALHVVLSTWYLFLNILRETLVSSGRKTNLSFFPLPLQLLLLYCFCKLATSLA